MLLATGILLLSTMIYHYTRTRETRLFNAAYHENSETSISSILKFKETELEKTTSDYAVWDDMVDFVKSTDDGWALENIEASIYTLDMCIAGVYFPDFSLRYSIADSIYFRYRNFSVSSNDIQAALAGKKNCHFFLLIPEGLIEITGSPIVPSSDTEKTSQPRGYLIWGRIWDSLFLKTMEESCNAAIAIVPVNSRSGPDVTRYRMGKENLIVRKLLPGSNGTPVAQVIFTSKNQLHLRQNILFYFTLIPIMITLAMGIAFFFTFRAWVSVPLKLIAKSLEKENPAPLAKISVSNKEFHSIALMIDAFFEAKKKEIRNLEERKIAEERILKLSTALEQSYETIVITDSAGDIEYVNKRFYELTGYSRNEAIGKNPRILKSGLHTQEFYRDLWNTISSGNVWKGELLNRKKDGTLYWENTSIAPIKNHEGDTINYLAVKEDITERKHDEERLKQYAEELKESNLSKDKFFSILAHDLKSPFHSLLGYTEILSNEYDTLSDAERRKFIWILRNSTKNVYELVENLLQWSRIQSGRFLCNPEVYDISEEIEYAVDVLRATALKKNIEMTNRVIHHTMVKADKNMVRSILQNIISNALKFTMGGGSVFIDAFPKGDFIEFIIRDTGIGMSAEELGMLFRIDISFTHKGTAQETGTGLGLILCKELVQKNMGELSVSSEVNKGSAISFTLLAG